MAVSSISEIQTQFSGKRQSQLKSCDLQCQRRTFAGNFLTTLSQFANARAALRGRFTLGSPAVGRQEKVSR
jgi:hypothetical protein